MSNPAFNTANIKYSLIERKSKYSQQLQIMKIIYIAGRGRSGSTLLESHLQTNFGWFAAGELRLWDKTILANVLCSCGNSVATCKFWQSVFDDIGADIDLKLTMKNHSQLYRWWNTLLLVLPYRKKLVTWLYSDQILFLKKFYGMIYDKIETTVIVDSSKNPFYCYLLSQVCDLNVEVIHLVRDPRAVAYSWQRQKDYDQSIPLYRGRLNIIASGMKWLGSNAGVELIKSDIKCTFLKYEDFILAPQSILKILRPEHDCSALIDTKATLSHSISGNPRRLNQLENKEFKYDSQYLNSMGFAANLVTKIVTYPLFKYYGYNSMKYRK